MANNGFWSKAFDDANGLLNPTYTKTGNMQASESKRPNKREYLKNLACKGLQKVKTVTKRPVARNNGEPNNPGASSITPPLSEYESRFHVNVPRSEVELLEALEKGKHPEILEMAIAQRMKFVPTSYDRASEYMILSGMLDAIKENLRSGNLDNIQRKTLEELHREYDWVQYQ